LYYLVQFCLRFSILIFQRYQAHQESLKQELGMHKLTLDRILSGLKATKHGDLRWFLGDEIPVPYTDIHRGHTVPEIPAMAMVSEFYQHKEPEISFVMEAFAELERTRLLLSWSYPFALFRFERTSFPHSYYANHGMVSPTADFSDFLSAFSGSQALVEQAVEKLSGLLSHKRLRGSKNDIVLATVESKDARAKFERVIVQLEEQVKNSIDVDISSSLDISRSVSPRPSTAAHNKVELVLSEQSKGSSLRKERTSQQQQKAVQIEIVRATDDDSDYGYNSADGEDLQAYSDTTVSYLSFCIITVLKVICLFFTLFCS
jgi:hypothetical protein